MFDKQVYQAIYATWNDIGDDALAAGIPDQNEYAVEACLDYIRDGKAAEMVSSAINKFGIEKVLSDLTEHCHLC